MGSERKGPFREARIRYLKPPAPFPYAIPVGCGIVWDQLENAGIPGVKGVWSAVAHPSRLNFKSLYGEINSSCYPTRPLLIGTSFILLYFESGPGEGGVLSYARQGQQRRPLPNIP